MPPAARGLLGLAISSWLLSGRRVPIILQQGPRIKVPRAAGPLDPQKTFV